MPSQKNQGKRKVFALILSILLGLVFTPVFASTPGNIYISPSSGTTAPNVSRTFSCVYQDLSGWTTLKETYLLIHINPTSFTNVAYFYYDQKTNLFYLRDDANTTWLGGYAPGAASIIENSQVKLNCASSSRSGSGANLTVKFNVTFKSSYLGKKYNTYLYVKDETGASAGWLMGGTYSVTYSPVAGIITPASGTGAVETTQAFTSAFSDADGYQNIDFVYFLINATTSGLNCPYFYYNQTTNKFYVRNDDDTAWLGGYAPGSSNVIENSYAKLNCASTSITRSGINLAVVWSIAIKKPFTGLMNTYTYVVDNLGATSGYVKGGTWTIPNNAPQIGTLSPVSGSSIINNAVNFSSSFSDADGWQNIGNAYFLSNTSTSLTNCFYVYYNQNTNKLYLRNNSNSSWTGGYAPGSAKVIDNSYAKLDCSKTTVSGSGNTLTINWNVTFRTGSAGTKNLYLSVQDDAGASVSLVNKGTWTIYTDITPPTGTIKINNDNQYTNSTAVSLNLSAQDNTGGTGISQMQFLNDNSTWSTPEAYAASKAWTVSAGEGTKTVYVKYKDVAGNWSSGYSDTIILDTTAPGISINSVLSPTNQNVSLTYILTDNFTPPSQITVTGDNSPYVIEKAHAVTLTAEDKAGNSSSQTINFTIDKTAPVIKITSPQEGSVFEEAQILLTGTVDGAAFSETRSLLQEGGNVLTKSARDSAGNTASSSVTVYLYLGKSIGPAGGEVSSADGKIKVIIPEGALTETKQIKVLNVNKETLAQSAPSNSSLLSVVECKPYGLVFYKPVQLIYTLYQAEIPGTRVELGLYDAVQGKILPQGQVSIVPVDGYTLNFSLFHFSTYAALKNLTSQGTPIGGGVQIPLPDMFTGAFGHAIPITVPPGRKGLQPGLALSYRSSNANSWVGLGYSLNPGYIVRSTKLGPPTYIDNQDSFYLVTDSGTTELVWLVDNLYQAKIESGFAKYFKETDDSWRVVGKDGSVLRFGQSQDAKEGSSEGTFSWYVTKASDTNGNFLEFNYSKDQGKVYLSRIDYTGNEAGVSPTNSVEFFLESREDVPSSYMSSVKVATAKRLKEIQVKVDSDLVWRYELEYSYSQDTNRSLLTSVTQSGSDGKSMPVQRFSYQKAK
ncbi:MAG: SpvB/TcaC N-terminal domain-containing protein [Candidatus Omnitrophota bacterium]|jgi:hypothetical protein